MRSSSLSVAHFFFLPRVLAHRRPLSFRFSAHTRSPRSPLPLSFSLTCRIRTPLFIGRKKGPSFFLAPPSSWCFSCRRFLHFAVTLRTRLEINTATGFREWGWDAETEKKLRNEGRVRERRKNRSEVGRKK